MLTTENLTERYGISDRALRRRLASLEHVLGPYIKRGPNNALLFDDGALAVLDRLVQVERELGLGLNDAAEQVRKELQNSLSSSAGDRQKPAELGFEVEKLIESYEARIREQSQMISYLQSKLDETITKIPALPSPQPNGNGVPRQSRLQALRVAILGR